MDAAFVTALQGLGDGEDASARTELRRLLVDLDLGAAGGLCLSAQIAIRPTPSAGSSLRGNRRAVAAGQIRRVDRRRIADR